MSAPLRLGLFAAALALVFAASTVAGGAVGPEPKAGPERSSKRSPAAFPRACSAEGDV